MANNKQKSEKYYNKEIEKQQKIINENKKKMAKAEETGDMLNYQNAKDTIEAAQVKLDRLVIAKENPEKVEPLTKETIKEGVKEVVSDLAPSNLLKGAKAYASNLKPMTEEEKALFEKEKEDYKKEREETPEEIVTEDVTETSPIEKTPAMETPATPEAMPTTEEVEEVEETRPSFDWRENTDKLGLYTNALLDSIQAGHKRKANQAVALSGFAGPYGSTQKLYSEEETESPFDKIRKQTYENYISGMKATQDALNNVTRTDIKNKYKSVYDIDTKNTTDRQAYVTQTLGNIQNNLNIDLNQKLMNMKEEQLADFIKDLDANFDVISQNITDEGIVNGLKASLPLLIELSMKGNLKSALLGANVNVVGSGASNAASLGGALGSFILGKL